MAVKIELKRSSVPGKIPTTASLDLGELAINTYDGAVYLKQEVDTTQSIVSLVSTTYTGSFPGTASYAATASLAINAITASYAINVSGTIDNAISASYAQNATNASTASFAPAYLPLSVTSSMLAPYVLTSQTSSMRVLSSSFAITASHAQTASYVRNAQTASYALQAVSASYALNSTTASGILGGKATHIPYFITDTTLATSSLYQSGSSTVVINQDNATSENPEALYVWQPSQTSFNVISGKGNLNNYLQLNIQNTNQGDAASSDVVATAGNGNETTNYIDMGINGPNYAGVIGGPNDGYLYSTGIHLHIGNATPGQYVGFFTGGDDVDANMKLVLDASNQHQMTGSLEIDSDLTVLGGITGSLYGSASYAETASFAPAYLPLTGGTINGNVTVNGTASVTFLNVTYESASVIYSSGSNQFGDNTDDVQTLIGTVIVSGSQQITGSLNVSSITGSLFGSASYAITASYALNAGGSAVDTGSFVTTSSFNAFTSSVVTTSSFNAYTGSNTSQFAGTASYAFTASLAQTASFAQTASYILEAVSSSFATTASLAQTASFAQTASYVLQAVSSSFAQTASYVQTAQTASYIAAANVVGTVTSASHAVRADSAATADYAAIAGNGGVTKLVGGSGITLLPSNGEGVVTVIASAGGGVTIISGSLVTGSFVNTTSYTFNHDLGTRTPIITVFDSNYNQIIPENIQLINTSSALITFPTQESGFAIGSTGGTTGTALSASYATFSDYAQTASYYIETDPIFVAKSGSLATTGSNRFIGNQTITGSLIVSGSSTLTNIGPAVFSGSVALVNGATGSLFGTASWATGALTASTADTFTVRNNLIVSGNVALGDAATDTITLTAATMSLGGGNGILNIDNGTLFVDGAANIVRIPTISGSTTFTGVATITNTEGINNSLLTVSSSTDSQVLLSLARGTVNGINFQNAGAGTNRVQMRGYTGGVETIRLDPVGSSFVNSLTVTGSLSVSGTLFLTNSLESAIIFSLGNGMNDNILFQNAGLGTSRVQMRGFSGSVETVRIDPFGNSFIPSLTVTGSFTVVTGSTEFQVLNTGTKIGNALTDIHTVTGSFSISGSTTQIGNNTLTGTTTLSGSILVSGSQTLTGTSISIGNQIVTGSLLTSGSQTLIGNTVLSGSINISGSTTLNGTTNFYGNHTLSGSNTIIGNTVLSGSFEVSGSTILHNSVFIVTGSTFIKGVTQISGSTGITGSFEVRDGDINIVSGSSFTRWGNKLFNYGAFSDYTTQSGSANTAYPINFNTTDVALGIHLSGSSPMKIENKGIYNFQWSGQLNQGAGASVVSIWLKVNGIDVPGSRGDVSLGSNNNALPAWNYVLPFNANDAVELYWSSTSGNTTWVFNPVAINPPRPSTAAIIATITQIA